MKLTFNTKQIALFSASFVVLPGYVIIHYLGVETNTLFALLSSICLLIGLQANGERLARSAFSLLWLLCLFGIVGSLFSGVLSQLLMTSSLAISFLVAWTGWRYFADIKTSDYLIFVSFALVIGAIFAFFYAFAGGRPLFSIDLFGRASYFYITTFTNAVAGNLIRPAGIFDEPGALAMFLTFAVALNETLARNSKWSAILLFLGLVTGSLALFVVALGYLLFKFQEKKFVLIACLVVLVGGALFLDSGALRLVSDQYLNRLEIVDGRFAGDNRTHQIVSFFKLVDWDMTLRGAKAANAPYFGRIDMSSNPFSIYYGYGIFVWIPYLALEVWLLFCMFFYQPHLRFPAFAVFATLLQRPYIYNLHWAIMISVVVVAIVQCQKINLVQNKNPIS